MEGTDHVKPITESIFNSVSADLHHVFGEVDKLWGHRNTREDNQLDRKSTVEFVQNKELEAGITKQTQFGLMKDSDQFAPKKNADGSTTYTIIQLGLSNRPLDNASKQIIDPGLPVQIQEKDNSTSESEGKARANANDLYYSRMIDVTVPAGAVNLGECQFNFEGRQSIDPQEFNNILAHERKNIEQLAGKEKSTNNGDVELHAHGVYTDANLADMQTVLLGLTSGHPSVTVDWQAYPNTQENPNRPDTSLDTYVHYMEDRSSAKRSEKQLAPALDKTITSIGADHTIMVGFSHGGMFDARYLRHRVDSGLPKIETLVLAHPDLPINSNQLHLTDDKSLSLLNSAAEQTFVIGGQSDKQLRLAAFTPFALGTRLGNDSENTRELLHQVHATPITEADRSDQSSDQHLLNFAGISSLLNGNRRRTEEELEQDFIQATQAGRKHQ